MTEKQSGMNRREIIALIDAYLLGDQPNRESVFSQVAAWEPDIDTAVPIVRAIKLIGNRAADVSLIALRLALAGRSPTDQDVLAIRTMLREHKDGAAGTHEQYIAMLSA